MPLMRARGAADERTKHQERPPGGADSSLENKGLLGRSLATLGIPMQSIIFQCRTD